MMPASHWMGLTAWT
uniref:Uncharacterized protein n=1 Tax=Arundo donax TaxID=35708 RepID=A0A0A9BVX6_ARUDO